MCRTNSIWVSRQDAGKVAETRVWSCWCGLCSARSLNIDKLSDIYYIEYNMILKYIEYMYAPILPRWVQRFRTPIALTFCFIVILLAGEPLQNIISEMMATCLLGTTICSHISRIFQLWYSNWQWQILESSPSSSPRWRGVEWALIGQAGCHSEWLSCHYPECHLGTCVNILGSVLDFKGLPWCTVWWSISSWRTTCFDRVWCILISPRFSG